MTGQQLLAARQEESLPLNHASRPAFLDDLFFGLAEDGISEFCWSYRVRSTGDETPIAIKPCIVLPYQG